MNLRTVVLPHGKLWYAYVYRGALQVGSGPYCATKREASSEALRYYRERQTQRPMPR